MNICSVDGCNEKHKSFGYCQKHYVRYKKYGDPCTTKPSRWALPRKCNIQGCTKKHFAKGLCESHYKRFRNHGSVELARDQHGMKNTPEYRAWSNMKSRCYNSKTKYYKDYGGRGITVCDRWLNSFSNFFEDMGKKPFPEAELDREENNGNYTPDNCRWVTRKVNANNKRNSLNNKGVSIG